jgi:hypothetical protein
VAFVISRNVWMVVEYLAKSEFDNAAFMLRNVALVPNRAVPGFFNIGNVAYTYSFSCGVSKGVILS